jgi:hypothetical protein
MDVGLKKLAIEYQVVSESDDRENALFLEQIRKWLVVEKVDTELRDHILMRLGQIFGDLAKANQYIKSLMDIDAAKAA